MAEQSPASTPWPNRQFLRGMFSNYARLLRFVRPYWPRMFVAGIILGVNSLVALALPYTISYVVDAALVEQNLTMLNRVTLLLLLLFVIQAVLGSMETRLVGWTGERVIADLRETLYAHLQSMPLRFFNSRRTGELISRLGNDVTTIQDAVTSTLLSLLSQTIMLVGGIIIIFVMASRLTLVMLAMVPLAVLGMILLGRWVRKISRQVQDALAEVTGTAEEALGGVRIVKSFAREPYEVQRYGEGVERLFGFALQRVRIQAIIGPIIGLVAFSYHRHRPLVRQPRGDRGHADAGAARLIPALHHDDRLAHRRVHRALQPVPAGDRRQRARVRPAGHAAGDA